MLCQNRPQRETSQQTANVSRVIDSLDHRTEKQIVAGKHEQAFQRALYRLLRNRQMTEIKSRNQSPRQSKNCSRGARAWYPNGCHHRLAILPASPQAV